MCKTYHTRSFLEFLPKGSNDLFPVLHSCQLNMVPFIRNFIFIIHHIAVPIFLFLPSMRMNLVLQNQYLRSKINHNPKIPFPDGQNNVKMAAHASKLNSENLLIKEHMDETFIKALMDIPFAYL